MTNDPPESLTAALAAGGDGTEDTRYGVKQIKQISAEAKGGDTVWVSLLSIKFERSNSPSRHAVLDGEMACALPDRADIGPIDFLIDVLPEQVGHKGGSWNMMASCSGSCIGQKAVDLSWFKISEDNYDPKTKEWPLSIPDKPQPDMPNRPVDGIARSFTLPTKLPGGEYLLSCTLLSVHSFEGTAQPQYYSTAWRIRLAESGVKKMPTFDSDEIA